MQLLELRDEVSAILNRSNDATFMTDIRLNRWINQAERWIVKRYPDLRDVRTLDKTTLLVKDQWEYDISDFDLCHILSVWYINPIQKKFWRLLTPPGYRRGWDSDVIPALQIDTANTTYDDPTVYIRRGDNIELNTIPGDDQVGTNVVLWIEYSANPTEMSSDADTPTLGSDYHLPIAYIAAGLILMSPFMKQQQEGNLLMQQAQMLISSEVRSEQPVDVANQIRYEGP